MTNKAREEKKRQIKRPRLMVAAIACLSIIFLWQSGLIASFKRSLFGTPVRTVKVRPWAQNQMVPTKAMVGPIRAEEGPSERLIKSVKSLEKSTIKLETSTNGKIKKMPMPKRPKDTSEETASFAPNPALLKVSGSRVKLVRGKIGMMTPSPGKKTPEQDSKTSVAQPSWNHTPVENSSLRASGPSAEVNPEAKKIEAQAPAEQARGEKPSAEITADVFTSYIGTAIDADLRKHETQETHPKYPYSIQLASFRNLDGAKKTVDTFREKGIPAYWSEVNRGGKERWFRVYTGAFECRAEARKYREENNLARSLVKETPYTAFVGTYTDKKVLEDQTHFLENLDYVPYAIEEQDGRYRLFIGAFLDLKVAGEKQRNLESRGIQSRVIRR